MRANPYYRGPVSDHFDGVRFFVPDGAATDKTTAELLRLLRTPSAPWPAWIAHPPEMPVPIVEGARLRVTSIGHASHLIQTRGLNLLVDPVWSRRASPLQVAGPKRVTAPGVPFDDLPRIDVVLVTHNHYDHLDVATLRRLAARDACRIIVPLGNDTILRRARVGGRIEAYDWDERVALSPEVATTLLPSHHWSARSLGDRRMALWAAYLIETPDGPIYHVGDTAYPNARIFREVPARFGRPRLAILPIGAYEPRWFMRAQHVDPDESVAIFRDCEAHAALAHHWGTFKLTSEPRDEPPRRLVAALAAAGVPPERFRVQNPGEVFDVPTIPASAESQAG